MKIKKYLLQCSAIALTVGGFSGNAKAQWAQTPIAFCPPVYHLEMSGTNIIAEVKGGICLSTDSGASWTFNNPSNFDPINESIIVAVNEKTIFALDYDLLYVSNDNGKTWKNSVNSFQSPINTLVATARDCYAASFGDGFYHSADTGKMWSYIPDSKSKMQGIWTLATSGENLFAGTSYQGIFLSTDKGTNWTPVNSGLPTDTTGIVTTVSKLAAFGTNIFAVTQNGLFLSTNNGNFWTKIGSNLPDSLFLYIHFIEDIKINNQYIFVGTGSGIFRSSDTGKTWEPVDSELPNVKLVYALTVSGNSIFAGTTAGVYMSTNNGASWKPMNNYPNITAITALTGFAKNLYAGSSLGVFHYDNKGATWSILENGPNQVCAMAMMENTVVAGVSGTNSGTVVFSTDTGKTWWNRYFFESLWGTLTCLTVNGKYVFAGLSGYDGIDVSQDSGSSWTEMTNGILPKNISSYNVATYCLATYDGAVFASSHYNQGYLFRSTNNGNLWEETDSGLTDFGYCFAASGTNYFLGTHGHGVFRSADNGAHWKNDGVGLSGYVNNLLAYGGNIFAGTDNGVFLSVNNGDSWENIDTGIINNHVNALAILDTNIFAGTADGHIYRLPLAEVVSKIAPNKISNFQVSNHVAIANKLNGVSIISFSIPASGRVSLVVYNLSGKRVAVIANENIIAGAHTIKWNNKTLGAGCYTLKLETSSGFQSKFFTLFK